MIGMKTSFGKSGIHDWWMQRLSAVLMLVFTIVLSYQLIMFEELNFVTWSSLFSSVWMKAFTFLIVVAISIHAWVGLWIVSTDYIKPVAIRNSFQAFVLVICVGIIVWAGMIFWG